MANEKWVLKRNDTGDTVQFDQDVRWIDEFAWAVVAQANPVRTLTGKLLIHQGTKTAGRPITLSGEWVWHNRGQLETLREWSDIPALKMTLTHYDGREFSVIYRTHESALSAEPVIYMTPEQTTEPYTATINLMTI